jgi:hypothetical protein
LCIAGSVRGFAQAAAPLRLVQTITLPDIEGRVGDPGIDLAGQRLFVPALSAGLVVVVHLGSGKILAPITGIKSPQSALHIPEGNRLVISSRDEGVRILDATSGQLMASIKAGYADRLRYQVLSKAILATHATGVLIINLNGRVRGDVHVESQPQAIETETSGTRFFIADTVRKTIMVADSNSGSIKSMWPVLSDATTHCIAYDDPNKRLFLVGRRPSRILTLDGFSGVTIDQRDTISDASAALYDHTGKRLVIVGNGEVDIVRQLTADHYEPLARVTTRKGTRTARYVPELNRLVIAAAKTDSQPAALLIYEVSR